MRIALIKVGALGDVVRTTSILPALRRRFENLRLTWITARNALDLIKYAPEVSQAIAIEEITDRWIHRHAYDWAISLDDEIAPCRLASSLRTKRLSGAFLSAHGNQEYTQDMELWFGMGRLRQSQEGGLDRANQLKRLNHMSYPGILYRMLDLPEPIERPSVHVPPTAHRRADSWWRKSEMGRFPKVVGLNTGAGTRWDHKQWGVRESSELASAMHDCFGVGVVVFGGAAETERNQQIVKQAARPGVLACPADLSLLEFADLIRRCCLLVTSDTLALHLASAMATPIVGFFGPTSASEIDLFGGPGEKVVTHLECRCCYLRTCDKQIHCMLTISVGMMLEAVRRVLRGLTLSV